MIELAAVRFATTRVVVSAVQAGDAEALAAHHARNREHLAPWEPPRSPEASTGGYWSERLLAFDGEHRDGTGLHLVLRRQAAADVIGTVNLTQIARGPFQACYLGFGLDSDAVGRGLMHEALVPTIAVAFEELRLHRIMANHQPENVRCARLLRRLGFVVEGYARDYLFVGGAWRDHVLTSLTNPSPVDPTAGA